MIMLRDEKAVELMKRGIFEYVHRKLVANSTEIIIALELLEKFEKIKD